MSFPDVPLHSNAGETDPQPLEEQGWSVVGTLPMNKNMAFRTKPHPSKDTLTCTHAN